MSRLLKNVKPYWKYMIIIIVLLIGQAYCDLALPQYTSDIIDTGIQNSGISHILPEKITQDEYAYTTMFMTKEEKELFNAAYKLEDDVYVCILEEEELEECDEKLLLPIILVYNMSNMEEQQFRSMIKGVLSASFEHMDMVEKLDEMSLEDIGSIIGLEFAISEIEDEEGIKHKYVDIRPAMAAMIMGGMMPDAMINQSRTAMEATFDSLGTSTMKSMGIAYAKACNIRAGVDIDDIQISYLWISGLKMLGMTLAMGLIAIALGYIAARVGAGMGRDMRNKMFTKVVSFSNTEMDKFSIASLITRSTNDIQQIQIVNIMILRMVLYAPIIGIGGIIKVIETGANMGWVIVLAVLLILGFVMTLMAIAMPKFKIMQQLIDKVNLVSREILTGISVIRAFGRERREEERFDEANVELTKTQLFTNRVMTFMMPGMSMIMYCITLLIVWVSANRIDEGNLQVGQMTAFITYTMMIIMSFLMLTMLSIMLPRAIVAAERVDEVLNTKSSILSKEDANEDMTKDNIKGVVRYENVSFKYPGAEENVLEGIDFTVEPGKTLAIIGSTGCGKSTLINLLPRLYDVTEGRITLDGVDIKNMPLKTLRDVIGYVPQKGILFSGTIDSNLRFGKADASEDDIEKAARIAQAIEFIEDKPDKYESAIAQGGTNVSGGQKQRLSIARAIAKDPKIFIFDDSFSALDMKTDATLRKAIADEISSATIIIVAQRVSTILHADEIIVLEDGKIVGKGTHEELIRNCDEYLQIAKSQLSAKELGLEVM